MKYFANWFKLKEPTVKEQLVELKEAQALLVLQYEYEAIKANAAALKQQTIYEGLCALEARN